MKLPFRFSLTRMAAVLTLGMCLPAFAVDAILDQGKRLLDDGKGRDAYELLAPLEVERGGVPAYDFLLGLSALEAGQNTRAVFALERVLAMEPDNARARAELARAYLALGEHRAAREEFEKVRQQNIPQGVSATIDKLLALIERAESRNRSSLKGFVELGVGGDSNVNSATESTTIIVPSLGTATLDPNSVRNGDGFATLAGGLAFRQPLGSGHALTAGLNAAIRQNKHDSQFDTQSVDGSLGWQLTRNANTFNLALTASNFQRDGNALRSTAGVNAQWQHDYDAVRQATLYLQYMALTYPDQEIRDADRVVLGAGYAQATGPRTVAFGSVYLGGEFEKAADQPQLGHQLGGARIGMQHRFNDQWSVLANGGYELRKYGGDEPLFFEKRNDRQFEAGTSLNYQINKSWKVAGRLSYVDSDSTIPVYAYERKVLALNVRLDF